jgi:hypothetical protein
MDPAATGVPFGCRSPRNRGPCSMPIHSHVFRHAIDTAQIAAVSDRHPQVSHITAEGIGQLLTRRYGTS